MLKLLKRLIGSANDRTITRCEKIVKKINALEPEISALNEDQLKYQTHKLKGRLTEGETLDDILVEAFATVRETSKRILGERHYDVQLMGGMVLHWGMIAEMRTGEGKTLVSTLPAYLNALSGKGVHIVTVNDYLAERDSNWMGQIHRFLGLTVGCINNDMSDQKRKEVYNADITYATNNELGFDYLRDNMKFRIDEMAQRPFNYAIVDEMDSILIDEARTPLIISGPSEGSSDLYLVADKVVQKLTEADYELDEKQNNATLTEVGMEHVETLLKEANALKTNSLYDIQNVDCVHHINQALKAHHLHHKDKDYIVKDGRVILIDEFTGRMMEGRRFSDGLHQALESKESVEIQMENQTLASITFQNFFRLYPKLSGMSGTAITEAAEFSDIYNLDVIVLPTNVPCARTDEDDAVYRTEREKFDAIVALVQECGITKQPVLIGTASIEKSEQLSSELKRHHIAHNVLNARYHDKEASIIAQAGEPGAVTIATNMAGRGTDIKLGGNVEERIRVAMQISNNCSTKKENDIKNEMSRDHDRVKEAGGLYVIGTERHESRRIDNQLRGRSGRQGDPGSSKFFLSLEDDLMRIFGSGRLDSMLQKLGLDAGEAITHPWINKAIERAQSKVEARNFDVRKHLLKYDDVMNHQRQAIYEQRREIMLTNDISDTIEEMRISTIEDMISRAIPSKSYEAQWNVDGLHEACLRIFGLDLSLHKWATEDGMTDKTIQARITTAVNDLFKASYSAIDDSNHRGMEKAILLRVLDQTWKDHLLSLDHLRQGINLRAYGQKDPLNEYKREAFMFFEDMLGRLRERTMSILSQFNLSSAQAEDVAPEPAQAMYMHHGTEKSATPSTRVGRRAAEEMDPHEPETWGRIARNNPCPCGSGKKYKVCHGKL